MNRVGEKGKGESVWLGWFLYATLTSFAPVAAARGEHASRDPVAGARGRAADRARAGMGRRLVPARLLR